ncbi:WbqC family protein [Pseudodesulfovibrio sp.]|uniref:WbqC family protein n=1 Tax=Pseudodesulfovibrio sp. TaxID=2035812 RepID=UPI002635BF2D|nr:WbqC family protein [Pseudodesulfovibrio sp.]MDD3312401.1 WbqC family protein [Pseudodesulfovibrio sp.]
MTTVAIMQPMYLPWRGFFELMAACDVFVHLDDVLLPQGRSFTNRVQVKTKDGSKWLTVPLARGERTTIARTETDDGRDWRRKHLALLEQAHARAPFRDDMLALAAPSLAEPAPGGPRPRLGGFNIDFIERAARFLDIRPRLARSSELEVTSTGSLRILELVEALGGDAYVTGHGARNYLDHEAFEARGVRVGYMDYALTPYPQLHGAFTPYVTILDLVANTGPEAKRHINPAVVGWKEFING